MSAVAPPTKRGMLERAVHDLKNPLAVVRSSLEWLETELADRSDALDAIRDALTASTRLILIVDDLDLLGRLDGATVARSAVDIGAIVGQVSAAVIGPLGARGISLASLAPSGIVVKGDAPLIRRSIESLVDVSARGSASGSCVEVEVRRVAGHVEIEVGVRGVPVSGAPEVSIDSLATAGLGGYLAFRVAEAHGGTMHVLPTAAFPRVVVRLPF